MPFIANGGKMRELELLNGDVPVLSFAYDPELHRTGDVIARENLDYAPVSILGADGGVAAADVDWWWRHRSIPASREQLRDLTDCIGVDNLSELIEKNLALSLSDRYWVRPVGSQLSWADVNFFDNRFSNKLGVLTLSPSSDVGEISDADLMSPNSTVGGNVPKKWAIAAGGGRVLLKAGTQLFDQDVFNEAAATRLYELALLPGQYVKYDVVHGEDGCFSSCANFLGEGQEFVSCADILRRYRHDKGFGTYLHCTQKLSEISGFEREEIEAGLSRIFSLDALLANFDRHAGNFGIIRNSQTLEYTGFAPTFDAGNSLWCNKRRLSSPSDFDYAPRPFKGYGAGAQWRQLKLFSDYRWLPSDDFLSTWKVLALAELAKNELMPAARLEAISKGIDMNIRNFTAHVERMARIYPALAPIGVERDEGPASRNVERPFRGHTR